MLHLYVNRQPFSIQQRIFSVWYRVIDPHFTHCRLDVESVVECMVSSGLGGGFNEAFSLSVRNSAHSSVKVNVLVQFIICCWKSGSEMVILGLFDYFVCKMCICNLWECKCCRMTKGDISWYH